MDSRGRITVVLHWEKDPAAAAAGMAALTYSGSHPHSAMPSRQSSLASAAGQPGGGGGAVGVHSRLLGVRSISQRSGSSVSSTPCLSRDNSRGGAIQHHSMLVQTSFDSNIPGGGMCGEKTIMETCNMYLLCM